MPSLPANPSKQRAEDIKFSRTPIPHAPPATHRKTPEDVDYTRWWIAGGVWLAAMSVSGGYIGYRMQLQETSLHATGLALAMKVKPHPFLKAPKAKAPPVAPVNTMGIASRGDLQKAILWVKQVQKTLTCFGIMCL